MYLDIRLDLTPKIGKVTWEKHDDTDNNADNNQ